MKNLFTTKYLLPLIAAMFALTPTAKLRADIPDDDLYFGNGYDFTMDIASLNPQASIYSSLYWSNISGLPAPDIIGVAGNGDVVGFWANGSSIVISQGLFDRSGIAPVDYSAHMMPPDDTQPWHWGTTGIRG